MGRNLKIKKKRKRNNLLVLRQKLTYIQKKRIEGTNKRVHKATLGLVQKVKKSYIQ